MLGNNDIFISSRSVINLTLCLYYCGSKVGEPSATWGPNVVDHFILCYVFGGKGVLEVDGKAHPVKKGQGFLVSTKVLTSYRSDVKEPLELAWVGFYGYQAESYLNRANLNADHPVFTYDKDDFFMTCFQDMIDVSKRGANRYCKMVSILYLIMAKLIDISTVKNPYFSSADAVELYLRKALEYIDMNYANKMTIKDISSHVGLDRKYLYSIFKYNLDKSPQEYLINYRVGRATDLLKDQSLPISDVARSVGYNDPFHFSKIFKKITGISPTHFRNTEFAVADDLESYSNNEYIEELKQIIEQKNSLIAELRESLLEAQRLMEISE